MRFKFITFDLNGTIFKPARPIGEIYAQTAEKFGLRTKNPEILTEKFKNSMIKMSASHPNFGCGSIGWEAWWKKVLDGTFEPPPNREAFDKMSEELLMKFATREPWELFPNVKELLHDLKSNQFKIGAITNCDPRANYIVKDFGLTEYFTFILNSYDIKEMKPSKKVFLHAEGLFGEFDRKKAVHVGDSISKDLIGAINAGWNAILISNKDRTPDEFKKFVCQDINELAAYLKER